MPQGLGVWFLKAHRNTPVSIVLCGQTEPCLESRSPRQESHSSVPRGSPRSISAAKAFVEFTRAHQRVQCSTHHSSRPDSSPYTPGMCWQCPEQTPGCDLTQQPCGTANTIPTLPVLPAAPHSVSQQLGSAIPQTNLPLHGFSSVQTTWKLKTGTRICRNDPCPRVPWASSTQKGLTLILNISTGQWVPEKGTTGHSACEFNRKSLVCVQRGLYKIYILLVFQKKEVFYTLTSLMHPPVSGLPLPRGSAW